MARLKRTATTASVRAARNVQRAWEDEQARRQRDTAQVLTFSTQPTTTPLPPQEQP